MLDSCLGFCDGSEAHTELCTESVDGDRDSVQISLDKQHECNIFPVKWWQPVDLSVPQLLPVVDPRDWYTWSPPGWTPPSFVVLVPESSRFPRTYIYFRVYDFAVVSSNHWCTVKWRQTKPMGQDKNKTLRDEQHKKH